jgi:hypothetical protein
MKKLVFDLNSSKWVCYSCGLKEFGIKSVLYPGTVWHMGVCSTCGKITAVVEPRDFEEDRHEDRGSGSGRDY